MSLKVEPVYYSVSSFLRPGGGQESPECCRLQPLQENLPQHSRQQEGAVLLQGAKQLKDVSGQDSYN